MTAKALRTKRVTAEPEREMVVMENFNMKEMSKPLL